MAARVYTSREIEKISKAGEIAFDTHMVLMREVVPGVSTKTLDEIANGFIEKRGAKAAFMGFMGFPAHICTSVNDIVVHGIPNRETVLKSGDLIGIDIGIEYDGYYADTAWTWPVGEVHPLVADLMTVTHTSLFKGIKQAVAGNKVGAIGAAVQEHAEKNGFSVVRSLVGHGVGKSIHEEPQVPNFGKKKDGPTMRNGMVLAIEPMVNEGEYMVYTDKDKWSVKTKDGKQSAHYEHTVALTAGGPKICTLPDNLIGKNVYEVMEFYKKLN
ncbi:MAG: type I methionyl aminopeptidase [Leptospirales bacterium]